MKITLPERLAGTRDALFVLEVEFPVATEARKVVVETQGPIEALDLRGTGPGGAYDVPVGLERLHVPMRVTEDVEAEATVKVTCSSGPDAGATEERTLLLEKGPVASGSGAGSKLAIAAILVALLGGAAWWLGPKLFGGDKVPTVAGRSERQAVAMLQKAEYLTEVTMEDVADRARHGVVLRTIPAAGDSLAKGGKVQVVVGNMQEEIIKVDSVVGQTLDAAEVALRAAGFQPVTQYVDPEPGDTPGRVKAQSPAGGTPYESGREVELFVAREPVTPMPDQPTPDQPTPDQPMPDQPTPDQPTPDQPTPDQPTPDQPTPDQPMPDQPMPDQPTPDQPIPDQPIPDQPATSLRIPPVLGLSLAEAKRALEEVDLLPITEVERVDQAAQDGRVVRQFPDADTPVSPGSQVIITIGRYSAPVRPLPDVPAPDVPAPDVPAPDQPTPDQPTPDQPTPDQPTPDQPTPDQPKPDQPVPDRPQGRDLEVPDLIGLTRERATGLVRAAGFRYRVHLEETADLPDGQVLSQRPAAGDVLAEGATIDVIVARAPTAAGVAVPDVVGKTREEAERVLRAESFLVRATLGGGASGEIGRVSAQSPAPGESRPRRTWVEIVVVTRVGASRQATGGTPPSLPDTGGDGPTEPDTSGGFERAPAVGEGRVVTPPATPRGATPVPPVRLPGRDAEAGNTVPDVANKAVKDAVRAVLEAGLIPVVEVVSQGEGTAGSVLTQAPEGGVAVRSGALVRVRVLVPGSTQERSVSLPIALGGVLARERESLRATGLLVEVIELTVPGHPYAGTGRVAAQYPVSSVPLSIARTVTLWVVR